jgi:hypothetical protein
MVNTLFRRSQVTGLLLAVGMTVWGALLIPHVVRAASPSVYVQRKFFQVTSGGSVSVKFSTPTTAGNLIVAYVVWDNGGAVSLTDSGGNTYVSAIGPTKSSKDLDRFYSSQ